MTKIKHHRGYIEGYYGRLLDWQDRADILATLARLGMGRYFYAPKEDPCHRFDWRTPYDADWRASFRAFTGKARELGIDVIAGIAPGLDYDFGDMGKGRDFDALSAKARQLADDGAAVIGLLMDDLDPGFPGRSGGFAHEGAAHASLANALAAAIDVPLNLTPRIYADDITEGADGYLDQLAAGLDPDLDVVVCGKHIVAHDLSLDETAAVQAGIAKRRLIIWDNFYANDYCPRRLFVGPWRRHGLAPDQRLMLNPTGMVRTDQLLLELMTVDDDKGWRDALKAHGVPDAFFAVADAFAQPPHPDQPDPDLTFDDPAAALAALDELLWRWKTPLSREWYPFLMGLRQDILITTGAADALRRRKILPPLLNNLAFNNPLDKTP
ncbi:MAG: beta-N-acetylglucosaminidase domain-containing protein [Alphaproteobacteria bacterium]|nr:beta-N-acetylglucosaminidase domain-containing protein [Alphaproteobacteria bacterium]